MSAPLQFTCNACNATFPREQRHACPGFDPAAMAARIDALASALAVANARIARLEHRVDVLTGGLS